MFRLLPPLIALLLVLVGPVAAQDSVISLEPGNLPAVSTGDAAPAPAGEADASSSEEPAAPQPCGGETITIARMQWPSAELLAEIHARLIKQNFGCDVEVVPGDLAATASSMGVNGQPAVAPELWISRVPEIWNGAIKGQEVRQAGASYAEPVFEGWFVPDYEVAAHPDLTNVEALKTYAKDFAAGGKKGRFISCPPDWACAVVNRNMIRANGLQDLFDIVEPANRFELDTLIAEAVSRKEPVLFYYWQPNAVLAQFAFKSLDLGKFDKDAFACLGRAGVRRPQAIGISRRSGDRGAGAMGLSRGAGGGGISAARAHAVQRNERAAAESQHARRDGRRGGGRLRRGPWRDLAGLGRQAFGSVKGAREAPISCNCLA